MFMYEASVICVVFDDKYEYEDVLLIGHARSNDEARLILMKDIARVMKDFGNNKCEIKLTKSVYEESLVIVHTKDDTDSDFTHHWHYYCLIKDEDHAE